MKIYAHIKTDFMLSRNSRESVNNANGHFIFVYNNNYAHLVQRCKLMNFEMFRKMVPIFQLFNNDLSDGRKAVEC